MDKDYKITYKTYFNERLNKVNFHGEETYPLYLQVIYRRKKITFKSYLFELLSKSKFGFDIKTHHAGEIINSVIQKELKLLDCSTENLPEEFNLDDIKVAYDFYSRDLASLTERDFRIYMFLFFQKIDAKILASTLPNKTRDFPMSAILKELEKILDSSLYDKLMNEVFFHGFLAAPYLILTGFLERYTSPPYFQTVMDWEIEKRGEAFKKYTETFYPEKSLDELVELIDRRIGILKEEGD